MKSCLSDLYRKVSAQIRRELKIKEDENKLRLYKHYIPFIVSAISESIKIDTKKLSNAFQIMAEKYVGGELSNIAKQIIPNSNQKKTEPVHKRMITSDTNSKEIKLNKYDTRTSEANHSNKTKSSKIVISRKNAKK